MAGFKGVKWAPVQMFYDLKSKGFEIERGAGKVHGVSRSVHYGIFLAFEGIRFFCQKNEAGDPELVLLNWDRNLERFRRSMSFNLSSEQQHLVPTREELVDIIVSRFFGSPDMREFLEEMAEMGAQGYLRPFTADEDQSIGVTFPVKPTIRAVVCRYESYLGEPFNGVVVPNLVRAIGVNGTGCLKLGVNYLMSIKAVDQAKKISPGASSALFLDDQPHLPLEERKITEWDSSCCLVALRNGTIIKIPESPLILPSVTIQGICAILREEGVNVEERDITYGELIGQVKENNVVAIASIGTAGILNRCSKLFLVDNDGMPITVQESDPEHELFRKLGEARTRYWQIYQGKAKPAPGMNVFRYPLDKHVEDSIGP